MLKSLFKSQKARLFGFLLGMLLGGAALAQDCAPPANGNWGAWLDAQEGERKGHALACHVNVAENGLIHRIENAGVRSHGCMLPSNADSASAWSDKGSLIQALKKVSETEWRQINASAAGGTIEGTADRPVGTIVSTGTARDKKLQCSNRNYTCKKTPNYVLVFRKAEGRCYLLTAYPKK